MPIVDIEIVCASEADSTAVSPRELADVLGLVFQSPSGSER